MSCSTPILHYMASSGSEGDTSHMGTSASFNIWNWNGVVGFVTLSSIWRWCTYHLGTHELFHMSNWHGVVGLFMSASLSMLKWNSVLILKCCWLCVVVFQRCIVIWGESTSALGICVFCYMSNCCGVAIFHTFIINLSRVHLPTLYLHSMHLWSVAVGGTSILNIYAFCYMWNLWSVMVFHRSIVN